MDFTQAKKIFARFLKQYDPTDEKIRLKIVHTYLRCDKSCPVHFRRVEPGAVYKLS